MGLQPLPEGGGGLLDLPAECTLCGNVHSLKLLLLRHPGSVKIKVVPPGKQDAPHAMATIQEAAQADQGTETGGGHGRGAAPPFSARAEQGAGKGGSRAPRRRRVPGRQAEGRLHAVEAVEAAGVERQWPLSALHQEQDEDVRSGPSRLSRSLDAWSNEMQLRLQTLEAQVWQWFRRIATVVRTVWAGATVEMFGSWVSGLQLSSSDVDLVLCHVPLDPAQALKRLEVTLQQHLASDLISIKLLLFARVPVAKVSVTLRPEVGNLFEKHVIVLDISVDGAAHRGIATTRFTREACASCAALRPLVLLLKQLVSPAGLNSSTAA